MDRLSPARTTCSCGPTTVLPASRWAASQVPGGGFTWKNCFTPALMERAMLSWCDLVFSLRDSAGLLIKPVSTRIEGISGDLSTIKAACSTRDLCSLVIRSEEHTSELQSRLHV